MMHEETEWNGNCHVKHARWELSWQGRWLQDGSSWRPGPAVSASASVSDSPTPTSKGKATKLHTPNQKELELAASTKLEEEPLGRLGADPPAAGTETEEQRNKFIVLRLYEALNGRDHAAVQALLAPDLEWWFHGPPKHQHHMMRVLTGGGSNSNFSFLPRSVDAFGSTVIAEGPRVAAGVYWVHAWTVGPDGVITQLREYFNTDLTVTRLAAASKCIWQSRRPDRATNSLPGLVLAL
ncbi:hypothetical protein C2845_PM03G17060 [Panicum miliaceum]|uniref:Wound-induced protein 1 n=1 Tax=Panicum miliaceum TaxID=4540 RepID=A0A3L6T975_PANMI|nr:hypothetical protein C2845_PM03G17060 [Panicum miliaceum]